MFSELVPRETIEYLVSCVEDSFGDEIISDVKRNGFRTTNGSPGRSWDFLNTKLLNTLHQFNCVAVTANRHWQMIVIYERSTGCILTFMKENRFAKLRKYRFQREHMHYVELLASVYNSAIVPEYQQTCLFSHTFLDDPDEIQVKVQQILRDLNSNLDIIRNHILVLFDSNGYRLTSIRAVKVTPSLDIALNYNYDWSMYISGSQSVVVESVTNPESRTNNPKGKIFLREKALSRKKSKLERREKGQEGQDQNDG